MPSRRLLAIVVAAFIPLSATAAAAQAQPPPLELTYQRILDDQEFLSAEVPANWNDTNAGPWVVDGDEIGVFVSAAPDLAAFEAESGPGVLIGLAHEAIPIRYATEQPGDDIFARASDAVNRSKGRFAGCRWAAQIEKYVDAHHTGAMDVATQCVRDSGRGAYAIVELMPLSQTYRLSLRIAAFSQGDHAALDHILRSVQVLNPQMMDLHHDE